MNAQQTGKRIQELRKGRGWTQKDLAQMLSVTDKSVSKWERGLNYPDIALLEPLASALGTSVMDLLGVGDAPVEERVEAVTTLAVEETERLKKDTAERAKYGILMSFLIFTALLILGRMLIAREVYDLPLNICRGCLSVVGFHIGNYLWIWWKYRK